MLNFGFTGNIPIQIQNEDEVYVDNLILCMDNAFEYFDAIMGFDEEDESMEKLDIVKRAKIIKEQMKTSIQRTKKKINDTKESLKGSLTTMIGSAVSFFDHSILRLKDTPPSWTERIFSDNETMLKAAGKNPTIAYKRAVLINWFKVLNSKDVDNWRNKEAEYLRKFRSGKKDRSVAALVPGALQHNAIANTIHDMQGEVEYLKKLHSFLAKLQDKSASTVTSAIRRFVASSYNTRETKTKQWNAIANATDETSMRLAIRSLMRHYRDKLHCVHSWVQCMQSLYKELSDNYSSGLLSGPKKAIAKTFIIPDGVKKELEWLMRTYVPGKGSWRPKLRRILVTSLDKSKHELDGAFKMHHFVPINSGTTGKSVGGIVIYADLILQSPGIVPIASIILHEISHAIDAARKTKIKDKVYKFQQKWDSILKPYAQRAEEHRAYTIQGMFVAAVVDGRIPHTSAIIAWARDIKRQVTEEANKVGYKPGSINNSEVKQVMQLLRNLGRKHF